MSDAWGGKAGSSAVFDPDVVKQLLADFERDVDALETYYNSINVDTMQRRETHKMTRQRAYDTSNRLRALLALPAKSGPQSGEKDRLLAQTQQILNRFTDVTRRTVDMDGEIVHQMRKSLSNGSSTASKDIVLNQQVVLKSVDVSQEMLREYNEELAKAAEGMRQLEEIAREMQSLTNRDGEKLTVAEKQVNDGNVEVIIGVEEQDKASKYACSNRVCIIIIVSVVVAIIVILALAIGLGIGLKKKKT